MEDMNKREELRPIKIFSLKLPSSEYWDRVVVEHLLGGRSKVQCWIYTVDCLLMETSSRKFNIGDLDYGYKCGSLWNVGGILSHEGEL